MKTKKQKALDKYYANPNICKQCGKIIEVDNEERIYDTLIKKFCNNSCSAKYHNKRRIRTSKHTIKCPICGRRKNYQSTVCFKCKNSEYIKLILDRPISYYKNYKSATRAVNNSIRHWARKLMIYYGVEKKCNICGFDIYVEVCHIKPISEFNDDDLMSEVNSKDNLVYLCPNHHVMFDRKMIKLNT